MSRTRVDVFPRLGCPPREAASVLHHPDDIPLHRRLDIQCCFAARPVVQAEEPVGGRIGWESHSLEAGCHKTPRDSKPSASCTLAQGNKSSGRGGRAATGKLLGEEEAEGEYCAVHQLYGECGRGESGSK